MNTAATTDHQAFDTGAAVTRSMLGWGVLAGPIYLGTGLALALTRPGFDLAEHQLSLLMLGEGGWMQRVNILLSALLVAVAAVGAHRAMNRPGSPGAQVSGRRAAPLLVGGFAVGLAGSGAFPPDPMAGFPAGMAEQVSASGILHLVFGMVTFGCAAAAAFATGRWANRSGERGLARLSRAAGVVVVVGFVGGAALSQSSAGVALLWVAVVTSYAWLAAASVALWRTVPHPDASQR